MKQLPERRALLLIAATGLAAVALAQGQEPAVRIVSPANGGVVEGRNVELKMEVQGVDLTPRRSSNAAYVQLRLDDLPPLKGYSETFTFQEVAPGNHVVRVELRRADGSEFRPPRRTQVRFTVRAMER